MVREETHAIGKMGQIQPEDEELVLSETAHASLQIKSTLTFLDYCMQEAITFLEKREELLKENLELQELLDDKKVQEAFKSLKELTDAGKKIDSVLDLPGIKEALELIEKYGHYSAINKQIAPMEQLMLRVMKHQAQEERRR